MGCESGGRFGWLVAQVGGVGPGCERIRWGWLGRAGGVLVAVALVASVLVLSERAVVAQVVPSVGVSADAAGALEGDVLSFTVASSVPVEGNRGSELDGDSSGLGVRVLVAEDGNVDVDADGLPEVGSGVLLAAQEGERSVVIPPGESEVVVAVETVGAAGSGSVTVSVTVLAPDGEGYAVAPGAVSASTVVSDDGADAVVFWSAADSEPILATHPVELVEDNRLDVVVRVVTDAAVEPRGFFSLQTSVDPGTAALIDYERLRLLVHFGSGPGANPDAAPFSLTSDGLRYTAAAPVRFYTANDGHYELAETLELVVERTDGVPATVRLGAGGASRLPILLFDNDYAEADITSVDPGDGTLTVTWEYARESGPFVQRTELQWRRSGQTDWPADGTGLFATGTTAEIPGLDNGVEYELRARPIVPDGRSRWPYDDFRLGTGTPRSDVTTPSVGISAGATEAAEGTALRFTVRTGAPVRTDLGVAVVVAEDGNVDTDADGVADAASGVLHPAQEGRRSVTIPAGASEAELSVLTVADETWENHATVTVTVSPSDDSAYAVDAAASSASTQVLDDDTPEAVVSLSLARLEAVGEFDGIVLEGDLGLVATVTFETAAAQEPHGVYGVHVTTYDGTTRSDYSAVVPTVYFGSGAAAPAHAVPFGLSSDGLRYEASATVPLVSLADDAHFELDETFDIALERTAELPASVRLGLGDASRTTVTILDNDIPFVYLDQHDNPPIPDDQQLTLSWPYGDDQNDYVTQFAVRWRRSDGTPQSEDREWGSEQTEQVVDSTPGVYADEGTVDIVGLDNGVLYEIGVRPVVGIGNYQIGHWSVIAGTPGIDFDVAGDTSPRVARGGATVARSTQLNYSHSGGSAYALRQVAADVRSGPSTGASVRCRIRSLAALSGLTEPYGPCRTDREGRLTLVYTAGTVAQTDRVRDDVIRIFADPNGDSVYQSTEYSVDLGAVRVLKAVDYVALGDSFSSGEQGYPPYSRSYLMDTDPAGNPADRECHRWERGYSRLLPMLLPSTFGSVETFACTGAISLNIYHAGDPDYDLPFTTDGKEQIDPDDTNRPSGAAPGYQPGATVQSSDWEPRQAESLRGRQVELGHRADMVTLTIGGNDVGFADGLKECFTGVDPCDEGDLGSLAHTRERLATVLTELKRITRGTAVDGSDSAAIFVLGYPYLVPLDPMRFCFDLSVADLGAAFFDQVFTNYGAALLAESRGQLALSRAIVGLPSRALDVAVEFGGNSYGATVSFAGGVVAAASDGAARAGRSIVDFGGGIARGIVSFEAAAAAALGGLTGATVEVVVDFGEFTADAAVSFGGGAVRAYRAVGESYRYLSEGYRALAYSAADAAGGVVDVSMEFGAERYDATLSFVGGTVNAAAAGAARPVRAVLDFGGVAGMAIVDLSAGASQALAGTATGAVETVVHFADGTLDGALDATLDFTGGTVEELGDLVGDAKELLRDGFERIRLGGLLGGRSSGTRATGSSAGQLIFNPGNPGIQAMVVVQTFLNLDSRERRFIRDTTDDLNAAIRSEADLAGVHFVEMATASDGHEPCNRGERDLWIHGLRGNRGPDFDFSNPASSGSLHPTEAGHEAYANALLGYIDAEIAGGATLTAAGLPVNPEFALVPRPRAPRTAAGTAPASPRSAARDTVGSQTPAVGGAVLAARRLAPAVLACGAALAPGERVELVGEGFAPNAAVTFTSVGATTSGAILPALSIPPATADAAGRVSKTWVVPAMPEMVGGSALRWYMIKAAGDGSGGGTLDAYSSAPLVAYASAAPCAVADVATTPLGRSVRVPLLANDTTPADGTLHAASLEVAAVAAGTFAVNAADGSVTFTPGPGFTGDVRTHYWVRDNLGLALRGEISITVTAGCTITGTVGVALIEGTESDDVICVPDRQDRSAFHIIDAKGGDDTILAGDGAEWIHAGAGTDTVYGGGGDDEITGGAGVDTIHGGPGLDTIHSTDLVDRIVDTAGGYELVVLPPASPAHVAPVTSDDVVYAATEETVDIAVLDNDYDPNENLIAASLSVTLAPTSGTALVVGSSSAGAVVRYTAGSEAGIDAFTYEVCDTLGACATARVAVTVGTSHCTIVGTDGDDTLRGTAGTDVICGLGGNDVIYGLDGDDILIGGPGDDTLYGGDETRIGVNDGNDALFGGTGADTLAGGNGDDTLWGGPGDDTLEGNRRDDTLVGGPGDDSLNGGGEDDTLFGGAGADTLLGHAKNDALWGGPGNDILTGGNGDDTLWGDGGDDDLTGGAGDDALYGGLGGDTLRGNTQNDTLRGGPGADTLRGGGHDDNLLGGLGGDRVWGDAGDDRIWGDTGDDRLDGGNGTDYIDGGDGTDNCTRGETRARCEQRTSWF